MKIGPKIPITILSVALARPPTEAVASLLVHLLLFLLLFLVRLFPFLQHLLDERDQALVIFKLALLGSNVVVNWTMADEVFLLIPLATPTEPVCALEPPVV